MAYGSPTLVPRRRAWTCCFGLSILPLAPSEGGYSMTCPPLAGVACFSGPGVDVLHIGSSGLKLSPASCLLSPVSSFPILPLGPLREGDIKRIVPRWRGWPEGPGVDLLFNVFRPPPDPLRRGTQAVCFLLVLFIPR